MRLLSFAFLALFIATVPARPGVIERACLNSDRSGTTRQICGCIQKVADATLSARDQKRAATFFKEPHRAQEIRQSDSRSHEAFWQRYKSFGATAASYCADPSR